MNGISGRGGYNNRRRFHLKCRYEKKKIARTQTNDGGECECDPNQFIRKKVTKAAKAKSTPKYGRGRYEDNRTTSGGSRTYQNQHTRHRIDYYFFIIINRSLSLISGNEFSFIFVFIERKKCFFSNFKSVFSKTKTNYEVELPLKFILGFLVA